jgi:hypothetical protein
VGSFYTQNVTSLDTTLNLRGFCIEAWVNYASLANFGGSFSGSDFPYQIAKCQTGSGGTGFDWFFGATSNAAISFYPLNAGSAVRTSNNIITTGQWIHIMAQSNGSNIYVALNGTFQTLSGTGGYSPAGGNNTIAPTVPTVPGTSGYPITLGQYATGPNPNFAIAKARIVIGNDTSAGSKAAANVYSSGNFTPNPNFAAVPAGATVAWQLESQYPLPTYPSIQDVTPLALQSTSYGALPTPVGGVTSNVAGPLTSYPQLDSIRFDGTGYIDYGNAASSVVNSNLWANAWTIEAWVYLTSTSVNNPVFARSLAPGVSSSVPLDFALYFNGTIPTFISGGNYIQNPAVTVSTGTWYHIAVVWNGSTSNLYLGGSYITSTTGLTPLPVFVPSYNFLIGSFGSYGLGVGNYNLYGNLADVRVSNVARYTGSSYTVPTSPFATDSATLLLLKSLGGQVGTTLEVQGRGLNSTSIGATRTVQSYPPAPMSSYLLDTTGNTAVTYGQGKYVASASSEYSGLPAWAAFDKSSSSLWAAGNVTYTGPGGTYVGSITTVDTLGVAYAGEWIQVQTPMSIILSTYTLLNYSGDSAKGPSKWWILGSRDGLNWTLVDSRTSVAYSSSLLTFTPSSTQAYSFYRFVISQTTGGNLPQFSEWTLNGTEEGFCISSDSKTGVGIANPQRALEVAGDLVVSGTISGGAGMGAFRNRIINGDMRIAQRGTSNLLSSTSGTNAYMIDRFVIQSTITTGVITQFQSTLGASENPYQLGFRNYMNVYVNVACTNFTYIDPIQFVEAYNANDLNWGTSFGSPVTLSFWFRSNLSTGSVVCAALMNYSANYSYCIPFTVVQNTWQYFTFTVPPPPNGSTWNTGNNLGSIGVFIGAYQTAGGGLTSTPNQWNSVNSVTSTSATVWPLLAGNFINFTGVQLEKGTVATPFEVRPYATELALCQRYYYQESSTNNTNIYQVCPMIITSSSTAFGTLRYPVPMRSNTVTLTTSGTFTLDWYGINSNSLGALSIPTQGQGSTNYVELYATSVGNGTAGSVTVGQVRFLGLSSTGAYIGISAEL